jgi:ATP-binding cassette, subfamily C, bacterial
MTDSYPTLRTIGTLARSYPGQTAVVTALLGLAGASEGLGMSALLPLFKEMMGSQAVGDTWIGRGVEAFLAYFGFQPTFGTLLGLIAAMMALKGGLVLVSMQQVGYAVASVETDFRLALIRSLMKADWLYYTGQASGRFANAIGSEAFYASHCYEVTTRLIAEGLQLAVYLAVAFLVSWQMTLAGLAAGGLCVLALSGLTAMARRSGQRQTELLNVVSERVVDGITGIKSLKAMACEDRLVPLMERDIEELKQAKQKQVLSFGALRAMSEPLFVVILSVGAYMAFAVWKTQIEVMVILMVLFWRSLLRIGGLQFHFQELARYQSAFWSLRSAIEQAEASAEHPGGATVPELRRAIEFRNVTFSHAEKHILESVSFVIPAGSVTAVVGPSGEGKTTIADLVTSLLRPQSGEILVDEIPLACLNLTTWRSMIGYTPQEALLFHDSVYTNVALRDPMLTRADAEIALKEAGAWDFVASLPKGIDTPVGERGGKLSGGQRQRILLARALVRKPKILILDEVTSSLDPASEAEIMTTLQGLKGKATILIISHRPASAEMADVVYRLENGRIRTDPAPSGTCEMGTAVR